MSELIAEPLLGLLVLVMGFGLLLIIFLCSNWLAKRWLEGNNKRSFCPTCGECNDNAPQNYRVGACPDCLQFPGEGGIFRRTIGRP